MLRRLDRAEAALKALGFQQIRVRDYGDVARLEFELNQFPLVIERRTDIVDAVLAVGYRYATLDLEGFRSGNLNHSIR